jgi:Bacterial regulatory proteins, lacI family/Periplasmic binding proteins and sugar binding domain of LacI family
VLPKIRMQDVARLAGVGLMTVSRALNKSGPVSEEAQRRVQQAVAQLNYRPNETARSLRQGRSRSIGLMVPNFYDPFYAVCVHAITVVANEHAYSVIVTTSGDDPEMEYRVAGSMLLRHVEGILVIPAVGGTTKLSHEEFRSTPIVTLDQPMRGDQFSSVLVDNRHGARMGTTHLIEHKHKRICLLGLSRKGFDETVAGSRDIDKAEGRTILSGDRRGSRELRGAGGMNFRGDFGVMTAGTATPPTRIFKDTNWIVRCWTAAATPIRRSCAGPSSTRCFVPCGITNLLSSAETTLKYMDDRSEPRISDQRPRPAQYAAAD